MRVVGSAQPSFARKATLQEKLSPFFFFARGAQDKLLDRDRITQPEAGGDGRECQAVTRGEGVGDIRSRSTVTFNEEGDYVPAAACRLDGGLGRSGIIMPPWNEEICCFLAGKGVLGSSVPVSRFAIPGGKPSVSLSPTPAEEESCPQSCTRKILLQSVD